jgi:5-methylcytosine-specific restriction endonuclease McrA
VYCSQACYAPAIGDRVRGQPKSAAQRVKQAAAMRGRRHPHRQKPPIAVTCPTCGLTVEYRGRKRHFAKVRRFCSTDCWYAYVRLHPEANRTFKGGREPYYGPNWSHQAKLARERDGHSCRLCGAHQVNPRLDVHHRRSRRAFGREDFEAMNALENLISLCKSCHRRVESGLVSV